MDEEKKVTIIPANISPKKADKMVVIYARESSNTAEQLKALSSQISKLTQKVASHQGWKLYDIFLEIHTGKTGSSREQFNRLHSQAYAGLTDIVISTTIARFGRNTEEVIESLRILRACDVQVIFVDDGLDSFKDNDTLMIELFAALAQAENENRSEAIQWGHEKRASQGESKLYNRKTYGYKNDTQGNLEIVEDQAENVKLIFNLYLSSLTTLGIIRELKKRNIKSPTGKDQWCKRTIDTMLSNEKYTGRVILLKNNEKVPSYEFKEHHEPIISEKIFDAVQLEKSKRSNIENGKRKSCKYSSKKSNQE